MTQEPITNTAKVSAGIISLPEPQQGTVIDLPNEDNGVINSNQTNITNDSE